MRLHLLLFIFMICCIALGHANSLIFSKDQKTYSIECTGVLSALVDNAMHAVINDFPSSNTTNVAKVDSIITVQNQGDTLFVFISDNKFVAFCYVQSGIYQLSEVLAMYDGESLFYINHLDVNHDNKLEFVSVIGDGINNKLYVHSYYKNLLNGKPSRSFEIVIEQKISFPPESEFFNTFGQTGYSKISHNKFYIIHEFCYDRSGSYLCRYGTLDYTRDKEREIYFKPISFITLKRWKRL